MSMKNILATATKELFSASPGNIAAWVGSAALVFGYVRFQDQIDATLFGKAMSSESIESWNARIKAGAPDKSAEKK